MSDQEISQAITRTVDLIEGSHVPDNMRNAAFTEVWRAVTSGQASRAAGTPGAPSAPIPDDDSDLAGKLAKKLGVETSDVLDHYDHLEDGTFLVKVPQSKLPSEKAAATRELALLQAAGTQFADEAPATPLSLIRDVCLDYSRYDRPNFAKHLKGGDQFWSISGSGSNRQLRLRKPGWDEASSVLKRIIGT